MSEKGNSREVEINRLAGKLTKLVEIFRRGKWASDYHWWGGESPQSVFNPDYGYQQGQPLFDEVVQGILRLNPEMLSKYEVETKLVYSFLNEQTVSVRQSMRLKNQNLVKEAENHIRGLIEFEAWQDVDIPIANLWLEGEPAKLGKVIFMGVTEEELEQWKKKGLWSELVPDVHIVARVKAPGDQQKALSYARIQVDQALDILRAFCFPFGRDSDTWRVGVVGDIIPWASTPMRINNRHFVLQLGPGIAGNELRKHILSKLEQSKWRLINKLVLKAEISRSEMERKLLDGIHWLAEATKPDTNNSKFTKISIALETLIGGEPKDEELKVRGITAMLAERASFVTGRDLGDRLAIDRDIREYYGKRSNIVHGGKREVSLDDIDGFGQLVRRLTIALLEKLDELGNKLCDVEELAGWVRVLKYTLPNNK